MDNGTPLPIHDESKFTVGLIAGRTYMVTEAAALGRTSGPSETWWFGRNSSGSSAFCVRSAFGHAVTRYDFVRETTTDVGKRCEYRGTDGTVAHVYGA